MQPSTKRVLTRGGASVAVASAALSAFLMTWESGGKMELVVYADAIARGEPTVCDGLTKAVTSEPIIVGQKWTEAKCRRVQTEALYRVQQQLAKCFTYPTLPQSVFDMATSHAWNLGAPATCGSLAMQAFNQGQWELGCRRLSVSDAGRPVWSFVRTGKMIGGKPEMKFVKGLANRREAETKNCAKGLQ